MDGVPIFLDEFFHEDSLSSLFFFKYKEFFVMLFVFRLISSRWIYMYMLRDIKRHYNVFVLNQV